MKRTKTIIILIMICLLCVVLASCSSEKYTVNYQTNGGEEIASVNIEKDNLSSFTLPKLPEKEGSIFIGWYFDNDTFLIPVTSENLIEKFNSKIKAITIYAKWKVATLEEGKYLINFETNGGSEVTSISIDQTASSFTMPSLPTKNDHIFDKWYFDNGTFLQVASEQAILDKLSAQTLYITVYAKWNDAYQNAFSYLAASLDVFYSGINVSPQIPLESDLARLDILTSELSRYLSVEQTLQKNYDSVVDFLNSFDKTLWEKYNIYERYIALVGLKNENVLSEDQQNELDTIITTYPELLPDDVEFAQSWLNIHQHQYDISQDKLDALEEYSAKANMAIRYNTYLANKTSFIDNVKIFVNSMTLNDIRGIKVNGLADFLNYYDYSTLLIELTDQNNDTYLALGYSQFTNFIIEMRTECQLTKEDTGLLVYKLLTTYLDCAINDIDAEIIAINADYDLYYQDPDFYPEDYKIFLDDNLSFASQKKQNYIDIKNRLTQNYITETVDLVAGVVEIVQGNNLIETFFNKAPNKSAPELLEIATVSASIKTACDQLISTYTLGEFDNSISSLNMILASIEESDSNLNTFATLIKAILPTEFSSTLTKISNTLGLITKDNLEVFFIREFDAEENVYNLNLKSDEFFNTNLYILEAKLIVALSGDNYNYDKISASYDTLFNSAAQFLPYGLSYYNGMKKTFSDQSISLKPISQLVFEKVKSRFVITEENYEKIKEIATYDFITSGSDSTPENLEVLPFAREFQQLFHFMDLTSSIEESYRSIYNNRDANDFLFNNSIGYAVLLYALEVSPAKLEAYDNYMVNLANNFQDKEVFSEKVFLSYAFDGLFQEGCFTDADLASITRLFIEKGAEFVNNDLQHLYLDSEGLKNLIESISNEGDTKIEDLTFIMINSLKLASSLTIIANRNITTVSDLEAAFAEAKIELDTFSTTNPDGWTQPIATLKDIFVSLDAVIIDYFIKSPIETASKFADVMALFDNNTLNYFVIDTDEGLQLNVENEFFLDNLVILEAKILNILVDENNLNAISNLYSQLFDFLMINSDAIKSAFLDNGQTNESIVFFETLINLLNEKISKSLVIDNARYQDILTVSGKAFIEVDSTITDQDYETVIFVNELRKLLVYNDLTEGILEAIGSLYLESNENQGYSNGIDGEVFVKFLLTLYVHNIDTTKLSNFLDYLNEALLPYTESPFSKDNCLIFFALIADGLIDAGFSCEEINLIISNFESNATIKAALSELAESIFSIATLFHANDIVYFDEVNICHKLNYEKLLLIHDEIDTQLKEMLLLFENEGKYSAINTFINSVLNRLFDDNLSEMQYNMPKEEYDNYKLSMETQFNMVLELMKLDFDLKGIVNKLMSVLDEYVVYSSSQSYPDNNFIVFKAKVALIIFGDNPQITYNSVVEIATNSDKVLEKVNAFLNVYDDIKTIALYNYDENELNAGAVDRVNAFIETYLNGDN